MAQTEAQKRASAKYVREKVTAVNIRFYPSEADILEYLKAQPNQAGFVKGLIRKEMEKRL